MKEAQYNSYGGSEVIVVREGEKPVLKDGQVLIKVYAASINPIDWKVRLGYMKDMKPLTFPVTIGGDFSGLVTDVAEGVTDFKSGDEVYGNSIVLSGGSGSFAEFTAANVARTSLKPKSIDHVQAASLPLVGASAIQALEEHIKLAKGHKIFISGGSGGIGSIAIQLAKYLGAYVATTSSLENKEYVKQLGADEVIDYKTEKFQDRLSNFDAVFDTVGGETLNESCKVLKKGGILVSMAGKPNDDLIRQHEITATSQSTKVSSAQLTRLTELVDLGVIKPQVDKVFPLSESKEAFAYQETSHPRGKVVVSRDLT